MALTILNQEICPIGIGTWTMGGGFGEKGSHLSDWSKDEMHVQALVQSIDEAGQNFIDTAQKYGWGQAERIVGQALRKCQTPRDELIICTKLTRNALIEPDAIIGMTRDSLDRLGISHIDVLYAHSAYYEGTNIDDFMPAFAELLKLGLIRAVGLSNFSLKDIDRATRYVDIGDIAALQLRFAVNYHERVPSGDNKPPDRLGKYTFTPEVQNFCQTHNILPVAWQPLDSGQPPTSNRPRLLEHPVVVGIAQAINATPAQVALRWIIQQEIVPIPKSSNPDHIRENIKALDIQLDDAQMALLSAIPSEGRL